MVISLCGWSWLNKVELRILEVSIKAREELGQKA
jgi:hypothetical protein